MEGYADFSLFYDELQKDVPYSEIATLFDDFIKKFSSEKEVVVDIACGTGSLCFEMEKLGYSVIGVDISQDMLNIATNKKNEFNSNCDFICQDMELLDLYGASDVIICTLDSINHLSSACKLENTIKKVSMFTYIGGLFIFDINTKFKHDVILANNAFTFEYENLFCVWQNFLNDDENVNIFLDFFKKNPDGNYTRYSENFTEYYYQESVIEEFLGKYGFEIIGKYDDFSTKPVKENSQRILYICRKI